MKLITAGCSFTDMYPWPSYGDWLQLYFDDYQDISRGGSGNTSIYHTVLENIRNFTINSDTFLLVQWSSCLREDRYLPGNLKNFYSTKYAQAGSIFNNPWYDTNFVTKYFHPLQRVKEHQNYIFSLKNILKYNNIKFLMTTMLDPRVEDMLGEPGYGGGKVHDFYDRLFNECKNQLKEYDILMQDNFTDLSIIENMMIDSYQVTAYSHKNEEGTVTKEGHPSPKQAYRFTTQQILPKLGISEVQFKEVTSLIDEWEEFAKIKKASEDKQEPRYWPGKRFFSGKEQYFSKNFKKDIYSKLKQLI